MKKVLSLFCLLLTVSFFSSNASAQSANRFGVRGGVNFANLNDTDQDTKTRTGFMAGLYTSFLIPNSPVYIQPEVLYTQKGYEFDGQINGQDVTLKAKLDYIEIPVLARFDFITDGNITPHVYFGPYIGFNVSSDAEISDGENSLETDDILSDPNTDFGVVVGGGLDFGKYNVGVRYGAGLTEVFDNGDGAKNGVFSITAGVGL